MIDVWVKVYNSNEGVEDEKKKIQNIALHCIPPLDLSINLGMIWICDLLILCIRFPDMCILYTFIEICDWKFSGIPQFQLRSVKI